MSGLVPDLPNGRRDPALARWLAATLLLCFCAQGFHVVDDPMAIKPYMLALPVVLGLGILARWDFRVFGEELIAFGFFAFMAITALWAGDAPLAAQKLVGIVLLTLAYVAVRGSVSQLRSPTLMRMLSVGGVLMLALSLCYYVLGLVRFSPERLSLADDGLDRKLYGLYVEGFLIRMRGFFDSPNNLALVCIFLYLFYDSARATFCKIGKLLAVFCIVLSISVTGMLALTAGVFCSLIVRRQIKPLLIGAFVLTVMGAAIYYVVPPAVMEPLVATRVERIQTGSGRVELFSYTLDRAAERPLMGYGLNQSRTLYKELRGLQSSHNSFIEAMIDGGLFGLLAFTASWVALLWLAWRRVRVAREPFYLSAAVALLVFSQGNLLTYVELTILYLALMFDLMARADPQPSQLA